MVKQDPEYLKNQSRRGHAKYRWYRACLNAIAALWAGLFIVLFLVALVDKVATYDWGFATHMWSFLGFLTIGVCLWAVQRLILRLMLAYIRHTYGAEPTS